MRAYIVDHQVIQLKKDFIVDPLTQMKSVDFAVNKTSANKVFAIVGRNCKT